MKPSSDDKFTRETVNVTSSIVTPFLVIVMAIAIINKLDDMTFKVVTQSCSTATAVPVVEANPTPAYVHQDATLPIMPGTTAICLGEDNGKKCAIFGLKDRQFHELADQLIDEGAQASPFWNVDRSHLRDISFGDNIHYADLITESATLPGNDTTPRKENVTGFMQDAGPPLMPGTQLTCPRDQPDTCYIYGPWLVVYFDANVQVADLGSPWSYDPDPCPPEAANYAPDDLVCLGVWHKP